MNVHWLWPAAAVSSCALTWAAMRVAERRRLLDVPNERSSHERPVPRVGGVAIVLTFMAGVVAAGFNGMLDSRLLAVVFGGGGLVALVGLADDYRHVPSGWRLFLHMLAAGWALYWLDGIPGELMPGAPPMLLNAVAVLCIVWFINLFNFMDGIDGIASIETITVCLGSVVLYATNVADNTAWTAPAILLACAAGFLFWNYPPARIFLGDAGSGFLGFMMAVFCIHAAQFEPALFWAWIILLGVFVADASVTLARRMIRRQRVDEAHRSHAYQFASRQYGAHAPVSLAVGTINLLWLLPIALLVVGGRLSVTAALFVAYAPLLWLAFHFKAGTSEGQETTVPASEASKRVGAMFVTWNAHRRTTGLCAAWDLPLHVVQSDRSGLMKSIEQAVVTLRMLKRSKPEILFVQNPSLALTILATLTRRLFGYYLVVDAHNEGVRPFHRPGALVQWLTRRVLKGADSTIVSNAALVQDVTAACGRPLVLPDALPEPPEQPLKQVATEPPPDVAVIATFWGDEPIAEIMEAAATMPEVRFAFTGDTRKFERMDIDLPANVLLTGYLQDEAYWQLLARAAVVCDLTLKPDCLVCGAYEGLALAKPMVLSDNPATREIFGAAAILTGSAPDEIAQAVATAIEQRKRLEANARDLQDTYRNSWQSQATAVWDTIQTQVATDDRR